MTARVPPAQVLGNHPAIIQLVDMDESQMNQIRLVLELCEGAPKSKVAPKGLKPAFFTIFRRFRAPGPCPRPSPGLDIEFPV